MKIIILALSFLFSAQVFSKHNYYNQYCRFDSIQGEISLYKMFYFEGHHMTLISDAPGLDDYPEVYMPGEESEGSADSIEGGESMVFTVLKDINVQNESYDDGCWQGFIRKFERIVKIESLTPPVSEILNLKADDEIHMYCNYEHLVISGDKCDEI